MQLRKECPDWECLLSVHLWCKSTLDMKYIVNVKVIVQMGIVLWIVDSALFISSTSLWIGWTRMPSDCDKVCLLSACRLNGQECIFSVIVIIFIVNRILIKNINPFASNFYIQHRLNYY